jgi:hypothetical protein
MTVQWLQTVFTYPFRDPDWPRKLGLLCLLWIAGLVVPVLPWMLVCGYWAELIRQGARGEPPHLPDWLGWNRLLADGARTWGTGVVYSLPGMALMFGGLGCLLIFPLGAFLGTALDWRPAEGAILGLLAFSQVGGYTLLGVAVLVSWPLHLLGMAATTHVALSGQFAAAFRPREWWPVLRANLSGFLLAYLVLIAASTGVTLVMQFAAMTLVLLCVYPITIVAYIAYSYLVSGPLYGWAYREGQMRLGRVGDQPAAPTPAPGAA